jgi:hypothetical protein
MRTKKINSKKDLTNLVEDLYVVFTNFRLSDWCKLADEPERTFMTHVAEKREGIK